MTKFHRAVALLLVSVMLTSTSPIADGQTKFSLWFRERVGEKTAKDANKAKEDALWQKRHFATPRAKASCVAAVKKSKCYVCHVKGKKKEVRNAFGSGLSQLLRSQLKIEGKAITAALKSSAPAAGRQKVEKAFYECLDKALKAPVDPKKESVGTYGDRLSKGLLPVVP